MSTFFFLVSMLILPGVCAAGGIGDWVAGHVIAPLQEAIAEFMVPRFVETGSPIGEQILGWLEPDDGSAPAARLGGRLGNSPGCGMHSDGNAEEGKESSGNGVAAAGINTGAGGPVKKSRCGKEP